MAELTPDIAEQVSFACKAGVADAAESISGAFEETVELAVGEATTISMENLPAELNEPGLVLVLQTGDVAAAVIFPESIGILPDWSVEPDATGKSKLATLGQELSMQLLPEDYFCEQFPAGRVDDLSAALARGGVVTGAGVIPLMLSAGDKSGVVRLIWPVPNPGGVFAAEEEDRSEGETESAPAEQPAAGTEPTPKTQPSAAESPAAPAPKTSEQPHPAYVAARGRIEAADLAMGIDRLPNYSRSLLRIKVPVMVTLASKQQPVHKILMLGPGSIIQFDKSCEEMLDLDVGDQRVAVGEAVKVGDKFGLRITSIVLPDERFKGIGDETPPVADQAVDASE